MIRRWRRFRALGQGDRWLVIEAAVLLTIVPIGLRTVPFGVLRLVLARAKRLRARPQPELSRIAWAIGAAAPLVPLRSCLRDALAADVMLARRGFRPTLRFGIRKPHGNRLTLDAHAWLECDGSIVAGRLETLDEYLVLSNTQTGPV